VHLADISFSQSPGWRETNSVGISHVIGFGILLLLVVADLTAQTQWEWRDASGNVRSLPDLEEILRKHQQWIESGKKTGTQADLTGAHLSRAQLSKANLHKAKLSHADLTDADLSDADLSEADLSNADLTFANLTHADLMGANLTQAKLIDANLTKALLLGADLSDADLTMANLTDASLGDANMTHANLLNTNLTGAAVGHVNFDRAKFEPDSLPALRGISLAHNLELLTYNYNPAALAQLRKQFEDVGLREQERKITYALKRQEAKLAWAQGNFASFIFNEVFFDSTSQYGMSPGRPLILGVVLWFLCSLLYFVCMHTPGEAGLYRVYGKGILNSPSIQQRVEKISSRRTTRLRSSRWLVQVFRRECRLLRTSMFFSLMSAFNIGFRDINFGRWLRLLTRQEFDIKALGWARVIAGWQSLISVYLIALWVLTYFGRPFD
jgi:hypothetical protein